MRLSTIAITCLLLSAVNALAQNPPFPGAVLVNGGWVPCSHTLAIQAGKGCDAPKPTVPPPTLPQPPVAFKVGKSYERDTTKVYIAGSVQLSSGFFALVAECLAVGDGCFEVGYIRLFPINTNASDWTEVGR